MIFFPVGDDKRSNRLPWMVYTLIGLNVATFFLMISEYLNGLINIQTTKLNPGAVSVTSLISYQFLHARTGHLFGNMLFLWIFGDNIERAVGPWLFLCVYLFLGMFSGMVHVMLSPYPAIGASGAIFGLMGMYLLWFPRNRVSIFYFILFDTGILKVHAWVFVVLFEGIQQAFYFLSNGGNIAVFAHLGGLIGGIVIGWIGLQSSRVCSYRSRDIISRNEPDEPEIELNEKKNQKRVLLPEEILDRNYHLFNTDFKTLPDKILKNVLQEVEQTEGLRSSNGQPLAFPIENITEEAANYVSEECNKKGIILQPMHARHRVQVAPFLNIRDVKCWGQTMILFPVKGERKKRTLSTFYTASTGMIDVRDLDVDHDQQFVFDLFFLDPWICYRWSLAVGTEFKTKHSRIQSVLEFISSSNQDENDHVRINPLDVHPREVPQYNRLEDFDQYNCWKLNHKHLYRSIS